MKLRVPDYYKEFRCIDKDCTDTCCAGWEVDVDEEAYAYYETVGGEFGKRLASVMSREGGCHFILKPDKDCPFLNATGLCDLYTELGEDKLCETCAMYPRFVEEYGNIREMGIALSCKTAANLILTYEGKAGFETMEDGKPLTSYNDIEPEFYFALMQSRRVAYAIVQNRAYDIRERIAVLMHYAEKLQKSINVHRYSYIHEINAMYTVPGDDIYADVRTEKFDEVIVKLRRKYTDWSGAKKKSMPNACGYYKHTGSLLAIFDSMEMVKGEFHEFIAADRDSFGRMHDAVDASLTDVKNYISSVRRLWASYPECNMQYEHVMVYYIFRYFLKAVYDYDLLGKVKLAVTGYLMVVEMDVVRFIKNDYKMQLTDQIEITHLYSREVEHSDENFAQLDEMYGTAEEFGCERLYRSVLAPLE